MICVTTYNELENKDLFFEFCKAESNDTRQSAHSNMWCEEWASTPDTLVYQLHKRYRYFDGNGEFHIAFDDDKIIGCSGVYRSQFCNDLAIVGCRTWIKREYRNKSIPREYLLPANKEWALKNNCKAAAITFNEYNRNLIEPFKRKRFGEVRSERAPHHLFYNDLIEIKFPVEIFKTKQWLSYETLDKNFHFDWTSIAYKDRP